MRSWRLIALVLLPVLVVAGCRRAEPVWPESGKLRVLASFPPLYCFAKNVAGDDADVRCLLTGAGPHDYHPNHADVQLAQRADVLLINGLELDEFVTRLMGKAKGKVFAVADALPHELLLHMEEGHEKHADHGHKHGEHDPHVWLSPDLAIKMSELIAAKLGDLDHEHAAGYQERAKAYTAKLLELKTQGQAAFKEKKNRRLIATHDALGYFALTFNLDIVGNIQPRPGIEADAKSISNLVTLCKEKDVRVITVEPQYSKGPAETLQKLLDKRGVPVQLAEVDPLETAPVASGTTTPDPNYYIQRMKQNIDNLAKALP